MKVCSYRDRLIREILSQSASQTHLEKIAPHTLPSAGPVWTHGSKDSIKTLPYLQKHNRWKFSHQSHSSLNQAGHIGSTTALRVSQQIRTQGVHSQRKAGMVWRSIGVFAMAALLIADETGTKRMQEHNGSSTINSERRTEILPSNHFLQQGSDTVHFARIFHFP